MAVYYLSGYSYEGKQLVAECCRANKRSAARVISRYLNSKKVPGSRMISISEVYKDIQKVSSISVLVCSGLSRFRFILCS